MDLSALLGSMGGGRGIGSRDEGSGGELPADIMSSLMSSLGGGKKGNPEDVSGLSQQAGSLWKFLDEMAETDPEAYKKFLQAQAEALKEETDNNKKEGKGQGGDFQGQKDGGQLSFQHMVQGSTPVLVLDMPLRLSGKMVGKVAPLLPGGSLPQGSRAVIQIWRSKEGSCLGDGAQLGHKVPFLECRKPLIEQAVSRLASPAKAHAPAVASSSPLIVCFFLAASSAYFDRAFGKGMSSSYPSCLVSRVTFLAAACQMSESRNPEWSLAKEEWRVRVDPDILLEAERKFMAVGTRSAMATQAAKGTSAEGLSVGLLHQLTSVNISEGGDPAGCRLAKSSKGPMITELPVPSGSGEKGGRGGGEFTRATWAVSSSLESSGAKDGFVSKEDMFVIRVCIPEATRAGDIDMEVVRDGDASFLSLCLGLSSLESRLPWLVNEDKVKAKFDISSHVLTIKLFQLEV